jgi:hypothetical protein
MFAWANEENQVKKCNNYKKELCFQLQ